MNQRYRIKNWSEYNKSLIHRGSITFWFSNDVTAKWHSNSYTGKKGRPKTYSDDAILCILLIRTIFRLPLRALQGFVYSLIYMLSLPISEPSYTQICRRARDLGKLLKNLSAKRPTDIVFDSTGFKVYGEGEWKVKKHGHSKRRVRRKIHIGMDPDSGEIIMGEMTGNGKGSGDAEAAERLLKDAPKSIERIFGDGSYDGFSFRKSVESMRAELIVPPPINAVVHESQDPAVVKRNNALLEIEGLGNDSEARALWKKLKGYHRRSLVETTMFRLKQLTGNTLQSREWVRQHVEVYIKCLIVNKVTRLGMPKGSWELVA